MLPNAVRSRRRSLPSGHGTTVDPECFLTGLSPRDGAPEVLEPRDLRPVAPAPCERLLSPDALAALGYRPPGRPTVIADLVLSSRGEATGPRRSVDVAVWTTRELLVDVYRNRLFELFRPTTVVGLPAVEEQNSVNLASCNTVVGVAPSQALDVETGIDDVTKGRPAIDPCTEGRRVVEAIVASLPPL